MSKETQLSGDPHWNPRGVAVNVDGLISIADNKNNRILVCNTNGHFLSNFYVNSPQGIIQTFRSFITLQLFMWTQMEIILYHLVILIIYTSIPAREFYCDLLDPAFAVLGL